MEKLLVFHPGTTDFSLSRSYHSNVPDDKLFTTDFVANRLVEILKGLPTDGELSFLDWRGKNTEW
ncbi:short-chain dehydrogenase [Methylophaga nitratireducenticrescens]|uniref:Short chain dehydrogenase n=1 Tax=Methylophaga nitratireducenticrescens TaxID=754476 RepID=I1XJM7_METNJ|nr:short-chain dehydrogenase [Methylophaga nitratireducenticrescens]AFI84596.1 hypothetical protein Q7A_1778 [Methylophaga nitratireducenticrescens]AUZ84613.1 hypothetical protein CDW43_08490 [Methylophaga nitratireducenticrescens]